MPASVDKKLMCSNVAILNSIRALREKTYIVRTAEVTESTQKRRVAIV